MKRSFSLPSVPSTEDLTLSSSYKEEEQRSVIVTSDDEREEIKPMMTPLSLSSNNSSLSTNKRIKDCRSSPRTISLNQLSQAEFESLISTETDESYPLSQILNLNDDDTKNLIVKPNLQIKEDITEDITTEFDKKGGCGGINLGCNFYFFS